MSFIFHIANPTVIPESDTYIEETANLLEQIGIIGIEGTSSIAVSFCDAVRDKMNQRDASNAYITHYANVRNRGYLYSLVDSSRYSLEDATRILEEIDAKYPL